MYRHFHHSQITMTTYSNAVIYSLSNANSNGKRTFCIHILYQASLYLFNKQSGRYRRPIYNCCVNFICFYDHVLPNLLSKAAINQRWPCLFWAFMQVWGQWSLVQLSVGHTLAFKAYKQSHDVVQFMITTFESVCEWNSWVRLFASSICISLHRRSNKELCFE